MVMVNTKLTVLSQNIRSINTGYDKLVTHVENNESYDIILAQECWKVEGSYLLAGYSTPIVHQRKLARGGGIMTWIKNDISAEPQEAVTIFHENHYESQAIQIKPFCFINFYRPPRGDFRIFVTSLKTQIDTCRSLKLQPIFAGDANVDASPVSSRYTQLQLILQSANMNQIVNKPTRISSSSTAIDHVYMPLEVKAKAKPNPTLISDHEGIVIKIKHFIPKITIPCAPKPTKLDADAIKKVQIDLLEVEWYEILNKLNVNESSQFLEDTLTHVISKHSKKVKSCPNHKTLDLPKEVWKLRVRCQKLYRKASKDPQFRPEYKTCRKMYSKEIMKLRKKEYEETLKTKDSRKLWQAIKKVTHNQTEKQHAIIIDENPPNLTPNILADFFRDIPLKTSNSIPDVSRDPLELLSKQRFPSHMQFSFHEVTEDEVLRHLKNMKPKQSSGLDKISSKLVKTLRYELVRPMKIIANKMIKEATFPKNWKVAKVIPLHKKGDKTQANNYRPISLLPALSKIAEKIFVSQIYTYFENFNLFPPRQYGFRDNRSTIHAIADVNLTSQAMKTNDHSLIFLDFSKAFDVINHEILYKKLKLYKFTPHSIKLIRDYLSHRHFSVYTNNSFSPMKKAHTIGCPQGSVAGPLMYLIYTSDMQYLCPNVMFADDTVLIVKHGTNAQNSIQRALEQTYTHCSANKLKLNAQKTEILTSEKLNNITCANDNIPVTGKKTVKYLGVNINISWNWSEHVERVNNKAKKGMYALIRLRKLVSHKILKIVYNALVKSHITYAIAVWGPVIPKYLSKKLECTLKQAMRIIHMCHNRAHSEPLFKSLNELKYEDLVTHSTIISMYNNDKDNPLKNFFKLNEGRTRQKWSVQPISKGKLNVNMAKISNSIDDIRHASEKNVRRKTLSKQLHALLLANYNISCEIEDCNTCKLVNNFDLTQVPAPLT